MTTPAGKAWLVLAAGIGAWEWLAPPGQLLSEETSRWVEAYPIAARISIVTVGMLLTAHLADLVEDQYDIVSPSFVGWRRLARRKLL